MVEGTKRQLLPVRNPRAPPPPCHDLPLPRCLRETPSCFLQISPEGAASILGRYKDDAHKAEQFPKDCQELATAQQIYASENERRKERRTAARLHAVLSYFCFVQDSVRT